jgi:SAM-dependent methyltransferase
MTDARALNWRFVVPEATGSLLVLPVGDELVPGAAQPAPNGDGLRGVLAEGPFSGVVAADVAAWSARAGVGSLRVLGQLADAVAPGGYLYAGFPGRGYPLNAASRRAILRFRAMSVLRRHGLRLESAYVALPAASCPALIVPVDSPTELDYVLRNLSFPYAPSSRPLAGRARHALVRAGQAAAVRAPHRLRVAGSPAHALLAVRPEVPA